MPKRGGAASSVGGTKKKAAPSVKAEPSTTGASAPSAPAARRRRSKESGEDVAQPAYKCRRCNRLPDGKAGGWYATTQHYDRKSGKAIDMPTGDKCAQCGDLHARGFSHMSWESFCDLCSEAEFSTCVEEASETQHGKKREFATATVTRGEGVFLEVSSTALVLNERELRTVMKVHRLPKAMKSIPTVKLLSHSSKPGERASGKRKLEELYCFQDPKNPYRTARVVQRIAMSTEEPIMKERLWESQPQAVMSQCVEEQFAETQCEKIIKQHKHLKSLQGWIRERTARKSTKADKPRAPREGGGSDDESEGKESGDSDGSSSKGSTRASNAASSDDERAASTRGDISQSEDETVAPSATLARPKDTDALGHGKPLAQTPQKQLRRPKSFACSESPGGDALSMVESMVDDQDDSQLTGSFVYGSAHASLKRVEQCIALNITCVRRCTVCLQVPPSILVNMRASGHTPMSVAM